MRQKKNFSKEWDDPYLNLLDEIFRVRRSYFNPSHDSWENEELRVDYREGIKTLLTGLPKDARRIMELRYGLDSGKPMSQRKTAKELGIPLSSLRMLEKATLWELGQTPARYFYMISPYARVDREVFLKTLRFLRGSGFRVPVMHVIAQVGVHNAEDLQLFVKLCPEFFDIFTNEGCERLVKMGCEDPREQENLSDYYFDDLTNIDTLNFSPRVHEMLVYGNGIDIIGTFKELDYEKIINLRGITEEAILEICKKLVRLGYVDPRLEAIEYLLNNKRRDDSELWKSDADENSPEERFANYASGMTDEF